MAGFIEQCFTGPNLPATILLLLIILYSIFVLLGALDIDLFDVDLDIDVDADASLTSIGFISLKFLNIGNVPIIIWITAFGLGWWGASIGLWYALDLATYEGGWRIYAGLLLRNLAIGLACSKLLTQPLVKYFEKHEQPAGEKLIGQICIVDTTEVTDKFGQAKFPTDAAPLILNVRAQKEPLLKGERAVIVDYEPESRIYVIKKASQEVQP